MISNNRCDLLPTEYCNGDTLHEFSNLRSWEEEDVYYQFASEGESDESEWNDVCDRMRVFYADIPGWLTWGIDCEDEEYSAADPLEDDTDEIPF